MTNFEQAQAVYSPFLERKKRGPDEDTDEFRSIDEPNFLRPLYDYVTSEQERVARGETLTEAANFFLSRIFLDLLPDLEAAYIATGKRTLLGVTRTLWHEIDELMRDASRLHAIPAEKFPSP
ncbi:MAG: hypothetical protein AAB489_02675 [Patescibacteria group bacterium]